MNDDALNRLGRWPRLRLAALPTRLVAARNLAATLGPGAPELFVKMDAETGFALGGNKVRKLETVLGGDRLKGVTHLVTTGGPQSNHCRVTAGAAAHLGLGCVLVVNGAEPGAPRGNALLHRLFGADIRTVPDRAARATEMERVAREIADHGGHALVLPLGASTGLGALGYALAALELDGQLGAATEGGTTWVFVSASSCGTLAGLLLGFSVLGRGDVRLVGVSADVSADGMRAETARLATEGAGLIGWDGPISTGSLSCDDGQVGEGYGIPTPATHEAIALFGRTEGIVLDPVYTGKAAAGLLAWIRDGRVGAGDRAIFVHTGGHPALLA
jgi:1-aminocyclopropane-1-carboxylate deaminase/D-cysteine desulfhydrase-like pyridoxal-dependent ACC family enzyme